MKGVRVTVPATSANLGPGFDSLAVALSLHNTVEVRLAEEGLSVQAQGEGAGTLPADDSNLIIRAIRRVYGHLGERPPGLVIKADNRIPLGSGLGSSAAAVVAGLAAADTLASAKLSPGEFLRLAHELEGHADNAAAALHGGLRVVQTQGGEIRAHALPYQPSKVAVVVPAVDLPTQEMRRALPARVPHSDAAANAANLSLLLHGLAMGDYTLIREGADDALHEPYRLPLIPGAAQAVEAGRQAGAAAVVLSGAGPSLLAFCSQAHDAVAQAMQGAFQAAGLKARRFILDFESIGTQRTPLRS